MKNMKMNQIIEDRTSHLVSKSLVPKALVLALSSILGGSIASADVNMKQIGDLEIYQYPDQDGATLMMMFDTSGSMGPQYLYEDYSEVAYSQNSKSKPGYQVCKYSTQSSYDRYSEKINITIPFIGDDGKPDGEVSFEAHGCPLKGETGSFSYDPATNSFTGYPDRLSRVKLALIGMFADTSGLGDVDHKIGIGNYSYAGQGKAGVIVIPTKKLTKTHRRNIINYVAGMTALNGTPTANAFAEAGAYMMGTRTDASATEEKYILGVIYQEPVYDYWGYVKHYEYQLLECIQNVSHLTNDVHYCNGFPSKKVQSVTSKTNYSNARLQQMYNNKTLKSTLGLDTSKFSDGVEVADIIQDSVYFIGKKMFDSGSDSYSGFTVSSDDTKTTDGSKYKSPITASECAGNGIYFLTDGEPNGSSYDISTRLMKRSLSGVTADFAKYNSKDCEGDLTKNEKGAWNCMGIYADYLADPNKNPSGTSIKTAAVGFGSAYALPASAYKTTTDANGKVKQYIDCDVITKNADARNLCKLTDKYGKYKDKYGRGGFAATSSAEGVKKSIVDFLDDLSGEIEPVPSGTIVVPDDPYAASTQQAVAYYPSLDAQVGSSLMVWPGNMKKYSLDEGTLYGKRRNTATDAKLFTDIAGTLDGAVRDLWANPSDSNNNKNNQVESGGFYAQLNTPDTGVTSLRSLFIEDWDNATDKNPTIRRFAVNSAGKVTLDGNELGSNPFIDTTTYTEDVQRSLLNFLGFTNLPSDAVKDMTLTTANAPSATRVVGATIHSTPALVSYSAELDTRGNVQATGRDEYVLFGSSEGALHLVDTDDFGSSDGGEETFAFVPKQMLLNQHKALIKGETHAAIGMPKMGMDAPWLVTTNYVYDDVATTTSTNGQVRIDASGDTRGMFAYGGMRMGGEGLYGLNLNTRTSPTIKFVKTPSDTDFGRIGQIWAKPTKAKIKTSNSDTGTDVIVFGGGYDTCYEDESYQVGTTTSSLTNQRGQKCNRTSNTEAVGNAVYIINAETGDLIWSASKGGTTSSTHTNNANMTNSVVGGITVLDRNNDGFMDHLYFADLGGQVFRADFKNAGFVNAGGSKESSFSNTRVTRLLLNGYTGTDAKYAYRFYEKPVVSFYRNPGNNNRLFALINIISGDRSSPLSKIRKDLDKSDRLYGIMDVDITKNNDILFDTNFATTNQQIVDLADANFYELPSEMLSATPTALALKKATITTGLRNGTRRGWYYPLVRFDGWNNVRYTKGVGKSAVVSGFLFTTTYNPDMDYSSAGSCSAKVVGGSERQLYCLPYGVCGDANSKNGTAGFVPAGKGIQELTLGPRGAGGKASQTLLIGTRTIDEQKLDRVGFGSDTDKNSSPIKKQVTPVGSTGDVKQVGGDGSGPVVIFNERYTFTPTKWYESDE